MSGTARGLVVATRPYGATFNWIGRRHVDARIDFALTHIRLLDGGAFGDLARMDLAAPACEQLLQSSRQ